MKAPKSYEEGMERLNAILAKMQDEQTTLAEAVKLYAEAASLMEYCHTALEKTSLQIEEIDAKITQTMLHCYSLIHDDLPCMDNDDLRRGRPSCHKAFGEATAMLAGDVLLTEAFEAIANAPACPQACVQAAKALGLGAGSRGMVYGQELDLKYEALAATEEQLRLIHRNKTGALINAAVQMGAAAAGADADQCRALEAYAYGIGLVFQIVDDVLDVTSTPEQLGKPIGSDSENGKTTFATLYGVEGAMALAQRVNEKTCSALRETFGEKSAFLEQLAQQLLTRKN